MAVGGKGDDDVPKDTCSVYDCTRGAPGAPFSDGACTPRRLISQEFFNIHGDWSS